MSEQKFIKTEKREERYFDLYEVYTPQGDMLVKNEDGSFRSVLTYLKETKEQEVNEETIMQRYTSAVQQNNGYIEELIKIKEQISNLTEEESDLEETIEDVRERISTYEYLLPEDKYLEVEELSDDDEEEEEEEDE